MAFRRFMLCRLDDVSGVSGTGKVAEGVQFSTGKCAIAWLSITPSVSIFDGVDELMAVHGHEGKTELVWMDEASACGMADGVAVTAPGAPHSCI